MLNQFKKIASGVKSVWILIPIFLPIFIISCISCNESPVNPCDRIVCNNGGVCENGICLCPLGFSGDSCEKENKCITHNKNCDCGKCDSTSIYLECICEPYTYTLCPPITLVDTSAPERFVGGYSVTENCAAPYYAIVGRSVAGKVVFQNFSNKTQVIATVRAYCLNIHSQATYGLYICGGEGTINSSYDTIRLKYQYILGVECYDCTAVYVKL